MQSKNNSKQILKDFLLGGFSGAISKTVTAPLERIKLLIQTQASNQSLKHQKFSGIFNCFQRVYQEEGLKAFWKGNMLNVIRYFPTSAFMFGFLEFYKRLFGVDQHNQNFLLNRMLIGGLSGASSMIFVFPLDFLRTRISVFYEKKDNKQITIKKFVHQVYQKNGIKGFYQGLGMSLISNFSYRAMYFGFFDFAKSIVPDYDKKNLFLKFCVAQIVNGTAETLNYPTDTLRRRMMMNAGLDKKMYKNTIDCFQQILKKEGFKGLYAGCFSNLIRSVSNSLLLVLYDELKKVSHK